MSAPDVVPPRTAAWTMPAEWAPHERTWMAWPSADYTLGDTAESAEEARRAWAAVAVAVARFEPVTMLVDPAGVDDAARHLPSDVSVHVAPLDDAWIRDSGPTFVLDADGRLGAVDWVFNGWGAQSWAAWDRDALVAGEVARATGAEVIASRKNGDLLRGKSAPSKCDRLNIEWGGRDMWFRFDDTNPVNFARHWQQWEMAHPCPERERSWWPAFSPTGDNKPFTGSQANALLHAILPKVMTEAEAAKRSAPPF